MTRVLAVDDNAENLYFLCAMLRGNGFIVDEARHGAEALALARQNLPDLIVTDLLMPVMDGYTLLRQCRSDEQLKDIPFVVYTATYTEPRDERLALSLGAQAFIVKPAEPEVLMTRIRETLANYVKPSAPPASASDQVEETIRLKEYNEVLIHKLEQKVQQLERTNHELREEVAERQRAEVALRASEERYRAAEAAAVSAARLLSAVVEGTSDAVFVKDREGRYLLVNQAASRFSGKPIEAMLGKEDGKLFDDITASTIVANDRQVMQSGQVQTVEELLTSNGRAYTFHSVRAPYWDADGNVVGVVGVSRDITEQKKLEEQLRQAQKMEAVGRLAGGIAHDFNNLLTVICSYSEILMSAPKASQSLRDSAEAIWHAGERGSALTRQLLGFSRQAMLQPEVLDLNRVVAETSKMLRRLIGEDIGLTTVLGTDLQRVKVDPGQLDQVLMNLAVNARDAMPEGGRLEIETANVELSRYDLVTKPDVKPGSYVMLAMTDSGCGMAPEVCARIFEPFFTTKPIGKGTGLGLPVVLGIVQQSGGFIDVTSQPGRGTTISVYLPATTELEREIATPAPTLETDGSETVLLVEDDESVREVATESLQVHGYKVLVAVDADDALKIAGSQSERIDLILTDLVMPKISGSELAKRLRPLCPRAKILFMSGYAEETAIRHGLLDATVSFIQKPYTPSSLAQKVREVLGVLS